MDMGFKNTAKKAGNLMKGAGEALLKYASNPSALKLKNTKAPSEPTTALATTDSNKQSIIPSAVAQKDNKTKKTGAFSELKDAVKEGWSAFKNTRLSTKFNNKFGIDKEAFKSALVNLGRAESTEVRKHYKDVRITQKFKKDLPTDITELNKLKQVIKESFVDFDKKPELSTDGKKTSVDDMRTFINYAVAEQKIKLINEKIKAETPKEPETAPVPNLVMNQTNNIESKLTDAVADIETAIIPSPASNQADEIFSQINQKDLQSAFSKTLYLPVIQQNFNIYALQAFIASEKTVTPNFLKDILVRNPKQLDLLTNPDKQEGLKNNGITLTDADKKAIETLKQALLSQGVQVSDAPKTERIAMPQEPSQLTNNPLFEPKK